MEKYFPLLLYLYLIRYEEAMPIFVKSLNYPLQFLIIVALSWLNVFVEVWTQYLHFAYIDIKYTLYTVLF